MKPATVDWSHPPPLAPDERVLDTVLERRGLNREDLADPAFDDVGGLNDLDIATDLLVGAVRTRKVIGCVGDYDCDGVTSEAIVTRGLRGMGATVIPYVAGRDQGYGVRTAGIDALAAAGAEVVVVVDSGTNAYEAVEYAKAKGMTVVVVDHHPPSQHDRSAEPHALVNPHHPGTVGRLDTSAAGLALIVMRTVAATGGWDLHPGLAAIAAVGVVGDVMPMTGLSRRIVMDGLPHLRSVPGLAALCREAGTAANTAQAIAFDIAPRLNAAGRMGDPREALALLLVDGKADAEELAKHLSSLNQRRKTAQANAEALVLQGLAALPEDRAVIVFAHADIPYAVAGPVASQIAERYQRPTFVGQIRPDGVVAGSARGLASAPCDQILDAGASYAIECGGHAYAAGFKVPVDAFEAFRTALEARAAELAPDARRDRTLRSDVVLDRLLTPDEEAEIHSLEPWGKGCEAPVIASRGLSVVYASQRSPKYAVLTLSDGRRSMSACAFQPVDLAAGERVTAVYRLRTGDSAQLVGHERGLENLLSPPPLTRTDEAQLAV